jgi:hypothetical protein
MSGQNDRRPWTKPTAAAPSTASSDSRGVVRVYQMTIEDGIWRLQRDEPDFSPLPFHQRYTGTFSADGQTIEGRWETSGDGRHWELDFGLIYAKVG